jgi:hypothetical protein
MPDNHVTKYRVPKQPRLCTPLPLPELERNFSIPETYVEFTISG